MQAETNLLKIEIDKHFNEKISFYIQTTHQTGKVFGTKVEYSLKTLSLIFLVTQKSL